MNEVELRFVESEEALAQAAAAEMISAARRGAHIALSGGATPRRAYEVAAELLDDWSSAHLWFGDDRCVPPDHEDSNYRMVREALLDRVSVQPQVHRIEGELDPEEAARRYDEELRGVTIDLALMGLAADGHTASLFPDGPELDERDRRAVAAEAGMEPYVPRVTMTIPVFQTAPHVLFLVAGADKAEAAARAFGSAPGPGTPASLTRSVTGKTVALLDLPASTMVRGDVR